MESARTVDHSYSPATVFDIRYSGVSTEESNQQRFARLMRKYGLSDLELRLLILAPNVDAYGRVVEVPS